MSTEAGNKLCIENEKLRKIIRLDAELNRIQDLDILLERILLEARRAVNADAGSIYIREDNRLAIKYAQNDTKQRELPPGEKLIYSIFSLAIDTKTISGYVAATGETVNITDVYRLPPGSPFSFDPSYDRRAGYRTRSVLAIPLRMNSGEILGVLQVINARNSRGRIVRFSAEDGVFALHFADHAVDALQRAQLTRENILLMIRMAEARDPKETGAHVNRVAGYAVEIYERWAYEHGTPEHERERTRDILRMAAMLHDVGKVAISDAILKKPGRFEPHEYEAMKTHTWLGARLFGERKTEFNSLARLVALTHHENWDGSGYPGYVDIETGAPMRPGPDGRPAARKGEEIPLLGQIVGLADVYDALSCRRVYKEAWKEEDVLSEIVRLSGIKFDPGLVDIFFKVLPNFRSVTERYPDRDCKE